MGTTFTAVTGGAFISTGCPRLDVDEGETVVCKKIQKKRLRGQNSIFF